MHPFPHRYRVSGQVAPGQGNVVLRAPGAPVLPTSLPVEFDGPGDHWSPESLLVAAIADCYLFTFRGLATKSRLRWTSATVDATGTLDRVENVSRFTHVLLKVRVEASADDLDDQITRVATRAEQTCLITRSMNAAIDLELTIVKPEPATLALG